MSDAKTMPTDAAIRDGIIRMRCTMDAAEMNDRELRVAIKTLRSVLLHRQQVRATRKVKR